MEIKQLSHYINEAKMIKPENHKNKIRIAFVGSFTLNGFEETMQVQCNDEKIIRYRLIYFTFLHCDYCRITHEADKPF